MNIDDIVSHDVLKPLKNGDLVYIPVLKCACTYFSHHLIQHGFRQVSWGEIDWNKMHTFGHVMDPIKRRNKGVAEFFNYAINKPNSWLLQHAETNPEMLQVLQAPYFDAHSAPLHSLYAKYVIDHVHWIPMDIEEIDFMRHTQDLLAQHGIRINFPKEKMNESDLAKQQMYNIVVMHLNSSTQYADLIMRTFHQDLELYRSIVGRYTSEKE